MLELKKNISYLDNLNEKRVKYNLLGPQPFSNMSHSCDYTLQANALLSSVFSHDGSEPLLFPSPPKSSINCILAMSKHQTTLLSTLEHTSTVDIINALNNNFTSRKLTCRDTLVLMKHRQMDGGGLKNLSQIL